MRYEYPGGVLDHEKPLIDRFEREILPYTEKMGPYIGEAAMTGDMDAEEIIRRQHLFCVGLPEMRKINLAWLISAIQRWEGKRQ